MYNKQCSLPNKRGQNQNQPFRTIHERIKLNIHPLKISRQELLTNALAETVVGWRSHSVWYGLGVNIRVLLTRYINCTAYILNVFCIVSLYFCSLANSSLPSLQILQRFILLFILDIIRVFMLYTGNIKMIRLFNYYNVISLPSLLLNLLNTYRLTLQFNYISYKHYQYV